MKTITLSAAFVLAVLAGNAKNKLVVSADQQVAATGIGQAAFGGEGVRPAITLIQFEGAGVRGGDRKDDGGVGSRGGYREGGASSGGGFQQNAEHGIER